MSENRVLGHCPFLLFIYNRCAIRVGGQQWVTGIVLHGHFMHCSWADIQYKDCVTWAAQSRFPRHTLELIGLPQSFHWDLNL